MALNGLICAEMPLRNYSLARSLAHSLTLTHTFTHSLTHSAISGTFKHVSHVTQQRWSVPHAL